VTIGPAAPTKARLLGTLIGPAVPYDKGGRRGRGNIVEAYLSAVRLRPGRVVSSTPSSASAVEPFQGAWSMPLVKNGEIVRPIALSASLDDGADPHKRRGC